MIPATKIIKKFRYFFHMDTLSYCDLVINDDKNQEEIILYKKLGLLSYYFDLSTGKRILGLISQSNNILEKENEVYDFQQKGINIEGTCIFLNIQLSDKALTEEAIFNINRVYSIFHSLGYGFLGEVLSEKLIVWKKKEIEFDLEHDKYCKRISKLKLMFNIIY